MNYLCEAWIAIGLGVGTYLNWRFIAYRLRVFSESLDNALTMPEYLSNRFHDKKNVLKTVTAIFITILAIIRDCLSSLGFLIAIKRTTMCGIPK